MIDSILTSVKKVCGMTEDYTYFDEDIIMAINSEFAKLSQLGVGSDEAFSIEDKDAVWSDFTDDSVILGMVKEFVQLSVRLVFDPPQSSFVLQSLKEKADELEYRLSVRGDES